MVEVTCTATTQDACRSIVDLADWGEPGRLFKHHMLTELIDDDSDAAMVRCPACGGEASIFRYCPPGAKLALGELVLTKDAADIVQASGLDRQAFTKLIEGHQKGEWGIVDPEDAQANEDALGDESKPEERMRILALHELPEGIVWIITEAGRQSTTVLTPEEY